MNRNVKNEINILKRQTTCKIILLTLFIISVISPLEACPGCSTSMDNYHFPFIKYWMLIFAGWSLIAIMLKSDALETKSLSFVRLRCIPIIIAIYIIQLILTAGWSGLVSPFILCFIIWAVWMLMLIFKLRSLKERDIYQSRFLRFLYLTWIPIALSVGFAYFIYPSGHPHEESYRRSCSSNLKQIGLALKMYAEDNQGFFPDMDGARGLEILRKYDYLTDKNVFICPSTQLMPAKDNLPLTEERVSYDYSAGLSLATNADSPIAWDKSENHENFKNILYADGHVKGQVLNKDDSSNKWLTDDCDSDGITNKKK